MKFIFAQPAVLQGVTALVVSVIYFVVASGTGLSTQDLAAQKTGVQSEQETMQVPRSDPAQTKIDREDSADTDNAPKSVAEARIRARILHEAFSGALQVMHRDFFREDQKLSLPSKSLEDVFSEMARSQGVELRWLAVNANAMSVEHEPKNEFEKQAVAALSAGKLEFESATRDSFQFVGSIRLSASCVKCHVRSRTSNDERKAGLVITMPLKSDLTSRLPEKH